MRQRRPVDRGSTQSPLDRVDAWNQRSLESANDSFKQAINDSLVVELPDGSRGLVQVLPAGVPVSDWGELGLLILPLAWLRHRLFHRGEYSVVVSRDRRWGGLQRIVSRRSGMSRDEARAAAVEVVADMSP